MDLRWSYSFGALVCGPSESGKTMLVKRFLIHLSSICDMDMYGPYVIFDRVLSYYGEWQDSYHTDMVIGGGSFASRIEIREGLPQTDDYLHDNDKMKLIVLGDLMKEASCGIVLDLFTKSLHHKNLSIIYIPQNLFHQGKSQRDINLNTKYMVIFLNPRDSAQISHLARQVMPHNPSFLREAYIDPTKPPHFYIFLDLSQSAQDKFRFRSNIFPDDSRQYIYLPKTLKIR